MKMAGSTRLELATSGVTGRRSNQLNYDPAKNNAECRIPKMPNGIPAASVTCCILRSAFDVQPFFLDRSFSF
jgi:hypothetical protein